MPKAIIMAGGPGERFWPLTRKHFPKYRIRLDGKTSLLQQTFRRLSKVYAPNSIYVVTTRDHVRLIRKELPALACSRILVEPQRKNTAPAILFSTAWMAKRFGVEEVISYFPADHLIQKQGLFKKTLLSAIRLAQKGHWLVTVAVRPVTPATGLGYLHAGSKLSGFPGAFRVRSFTEKPSKPLALKYLKSGDFFWNGGIFSWRAGVFLETMKKFSLRFYKDLDLERLGQSYRRFPKISIDYALLEKTDNLAMVEARMDWCDMGNWDTFLEKAVKDTRGNVIQGPCIAGDTQNSLLVNTTKEPLVVSGVSGLIAVKTSQGILIGRRDRAEEAALLFRKVKP